MPLQRVTSLRRRAQDNAPAIWYRLRRVLHDSRTRDECIVLLRAMGAGGGVCNTPLLCGCVVVI